VTSLRVVARLVDGGEHDFSYGQEFLNRLADLEARGYNGKELIHALITDDWAAPPVVVTVDGTDADGRQVQRVLPYD
jgi:hypothetical protein